MKVPREPALVESMFISTTSSMEPANVRLVENGTTCLDRSLFLLKNGMVSSDDESSGFYDDSARLRRCRPLHSE